MTTLVDSATGDQNNHIAYKKAKAKQSYNCKQSFCFLGPSAGHWRQRLRPTLPKEAAYHRLIKQNQLNLSSFLDHQCGDQSGCGKSLMPHVVPSKNPIKQCLTRGPKMLNV